MSGPFGSSPWGYNPGGGDFYPHTINQSLRFEDGDSAYLSRDPSSAGDRQKFTLSFWMKRGNLSSTQDPFSAGASATDRFEVMLTASDNLQVYMNNGGTIEQITTTQVFRDVSAWYHIVLAFDTTDGTAANRLKVYVNGSQVTSFSTYDMSTVNFSTPVNSTSNQYIGKRNYVDDRYYDGYLAEFYNIDGTQLTPASFGETKDGIWIPKAYSGSYGTNGFHLDFADSSAIGNDVSGQNNDFTVSGGGSPTLVASDVVPDSPTNNFATWNPLINTTQTLTFKEGNLNLSASSQSWAGSGDNFNQSTIGVLGGSNAKHYFEFTMENNTSGSYVIGVGRHNSKGIDTTHYTGGVVFYNTRCSSDSTNTVTGITRAASLTIIRLAFDASNGKVWIGDNNGYFNSGDPANGTGEVGTISGYDGETLVAILNRSTNAGNQIVNFGQDSTFANRKTSGSAGASDANGIGDFYYAPPSGFLALCSANLPEPEIIDGTDHFNTVLYTGNGSDGRSITGVGFDPDFVWIKSRDLTTSHLLNDTVRGANKSLFSELTTAETADNGGGYLSAFVTDGFSVTSGSSGDDAVNDGSDTYVAWNWKAGGSASTIAADSISSGVPSIASSVSANTTAGFSIVSLTTPASGAFTFGHGLGVQPDMIIAKGRETDGYSWLIYHRSIGAGVNLVFSPAAQAANTTVWQNTNPSSSIVYGNSTSWGGNEDYIAYCFASTEGYSKAGSYIGGSSVFPFVFTGFRPAWVLLKRTTDGSYHWRMYDSKRSPFNDVDDYLTPNLNFDEKVGLDIDFLSNGFKIRTSNDDINDATKNYVYLAFAEQPFKFANAR